MAAVRLWSSFVAWVEALHLLPPGDGLGISTPGATAQATWIAMLAVGLPLCGLVVGGPVVGAVIVLALLVALWWVARGADARREAAADGDLPLLLEGIARQLRAGGSLGEAMATQVGGEGLAPELSRAWGGVVADAPVVGVVAALDAWVDGNDRPPVRLAAAALALAAETGGSPARAVDGVAATLRARATLAGEVRALTAQARASAVVIASAPIVFAALAGATDARTRAAYRTPTGTILVMAGLGLDVVGGCWMARLCRVRVAS